MKRNPPSPCAELVDKVRHGMAFGMLATVNGIGDFASSALVGLLWATYGTMVAFGYSAVLFLAGSMLVARLDRGVGVRPPIHSIPLKGAQGDGIKSGDEDGGGVRR